MKISQLCLLTFLFLFARNTEAQTPQELLTKFYFESDLPIVDSSGFDYSDVYSQSGSSWAIDSFPESVVFHNQMSYQSTTNPNTSYDIRIGKGGQLYSFRGSFGESVPPQWVNPNWVQPSYGGGHSYAPWVDEVWQLVSVDGSIHNPPDSSYFIHQAGVYLKTPEQTAPFYSPILAEYYNTEEQSYSVVNWGQQAHTEDLQNINHDAGLLYYTKYTNKGKGIIQVDNMIYNFGQDNMNFLNVPWGGVRNSSLDHFFISTPGHDYNLTTGLYGQTPVVQTANTGGWVAWSNHIDGDSPTLGMAHPTTTNTYGNKFRYGDAGNLSNVNNLRDYHVFEMIRQPIGDQLGFGKAMSFRYFYVLGASVDAVKSTIFEYDLVGHGLDSSFVADMNDVPSLRYTFSTSGQGIQEMVTTSPYGLLLKTSPYSDSHPLFKIASDNGISVITSNPYHFSEYPYDGAMESMSLLGFLDTKSELSVTDHTVCEGASFSFFDGTTFNNLQGDTAHISTIPSSQLNWDSLIVENVIVNPNNEITDTHTACNSFTWIDGVTYQSSTNLPTVTLENIYGCDSIIHLNLVIDTVNTLTTVEDLEMMSLAEGASYQWLNCDQNYAQVVGEVNQSFISTENGTYAVQVSENNCIDTSDCITILTVGSLNELSNQILVYPNPSSGILYIEGLETLKSSAQISILDVHGNMLKRIGLDSKTLNLNAFSPGRYYLEIVYNGQVEAIEIIRK
jgi:hypothetical protein